ncbi:MAG: ABC transporter permease [Actinomycetota bacterium]
MRASPIARFERSVSAGAAPRRLRQAWAVVRRDALIAMTYRFALSMRIASMAFFAVTIFYISKLVNSAPELAEYRGGYFEFAIVGIAVMSVGGLGVRNFAASISGEQTAGTLELLLAAPLRVGTLLTGTFVVPLFITTVQLVGLLFVGIGVFGVGIPAERFLVVLPILLLTIVIFCAIGIVSAAFIVVTKRRDPSAAIFIQVSGVLSGAIFPPALLPGWLVDAVQALPLYHSLEATRLVLLSGAGLGDVATELMVLLLFAVALLPISLLILVRALRLARVTGMLGTY